MSFFPNHDAEWRTESAATHVSVMEYFTALKRSGTHLFIPTGSLIESWLWIVFFNWMPELKRTVRTQQGHDPQMFLERKKKKSSEQVCLKRGSSVVETSSNTRIQQLSCVWNTRPPTWAQSKQAVCDGAVDTRVRPDPQFEWSAAAAFCSLGLVQSDCNDSAHLICDWIWIHFPFGSFSVVKTVFLDHLTCSRQFKKFQSFAHLMQIFFS